MCFGKSNKRATTGGTRFPTQGNDTPTSPTSPKSIEQQILDQEAARQAAVKTGNTNIDTAFSHFDQPFFDGYTGAYKDYYNPQVDSQYRDAAGTMEAGLARNGTDRSSIAATKIGQLFGAYSDERASIGNKAADAAQSLRGKVNDEKNNLYALNASSADPAQANTQALAASTALVAPPTYSPLGSLFANFLQPFTQYASSYSNNAGPGYTSPFSPSTSGSKP